MSKPRYKKPPQKMSVAEFQQYLNRAFDPCNKVDCYERSHVLVSYPSFDGRLRWCVCDRCGTYHVKPELPHPPLPQPIPSVPGSALSEDVWS